MNQIKDPDIQGRQIMTYLRYSAQRPTRTTWKFIKEIYHH